MRLEDTIKLDFKDVLIRPKRSTLSSRAEVTLERTYIMPNAQNADGSPLEWTGIPICAANMDTVGTFSMAQSLSRYRCLVAIHKHYSLEQWIKFAQTNDSSIFNFVSLSLGISEQDLDKTRQILTSVPQIKILTVDIANGYSEPFVEFIKNLRKMFPEKIIFAGNVVTAEMTEELILAGADCVKIGIGSGSACRTRTQTGVGYPQLSAIIECADAAHGIGFNQAKGLIMADGGITCPGDVAKAFGAGADFIMIGGLFAGHEQSEGTIVTKQDSNGNLEKFVEFYGMSSQMAMKKYHGGVAEYRSSEGKELLVKYRGSVDHTIRDILGGLRSACTYVGARYLKELSKRTTFVRVTQQINNFLGA